MVCTSSYFFLLTSSKSKFDRRMKSSISSFHHHSGRHLSSLTSIASRALTATQSAFKALSDPTRGQDVARLGDITSSPFLPRIRDLMLLDPTGRRILREQPMISSDSIHLHSRLSRMKQGSFGKSYADFMRVNGITPDSRQRVNKEHSLVFKSYNDTLRLFKNTSLIKNSNTF